MVEQVMIQTRVQLNPPMIQTVRSSISLENLKSGGGVGGWRQPPQDARRSDDSTRDAIQSL